MRGISSHGVNGFTLDSSIGEFLLTHPNIQIPRVGKYYSANHGYYNYWDEATQKAVHSFSRPTGMPPRSPCPVRRRALSAGGRKERLPLYV